MYKKRVIRIGTRGSKLAIAQSQIIAEKLEELGWVSKLIIIKTSGDSILDIPLPDIDIKGMFVSEIEEALISNQIDIAVHSMKDLPLNMPNILSCPIVPLREDPRDVLVSRNGEKLSELGSSAVVGTSSIRRKMQLLDERPDLNIKNIRGNIDTRIQKLDSGQYDAICIAAAGLHRLKFENRISEYLSPEIVMPAAGQGALAIQIRKDDLQLSAALEPINDNYSNISVKTERIILETLGWGCSVPLGVLVKTNDSGIRIQARLYSIEGKSKLYCELFGKDGAEILGKKMGNLLKRYIDANG